MDRARVRSDGVASDDPSTLGERLPAGLHPIVRSIGERYGIGTCGPDDEFPRRNLWGRSAGLIWLVFLVEPLYQCVTNPHTTLTHRIVTVAVAAVFAGIFAALNLLPDWWTGQLPRGETTAVVLVLWTLATFLVFYDSPQWAYDFVFSIFPAIRLFGRRPISIPILASLAVTIGALGGLDLGDLLIVALIMVGSGASMFGVFRLVEAHSALQRANDNQARVAVAEERLRFARDLHDLLGHSLSVISLKSEVAARVLASDQGRAERELVEIQDVARRALREVRETVSGYRQTTLAVELAGARTALAAAGVSWHEDVGEVALPGDVEAALAWTLREGVTNVVRHAQATTCWLRLQVDDQRATITIADNGEGPYPDGDTSAWGNGLIGLGERVAAVAGRLETGGRLEPAAPPDSAAEREPGGRGQIGARDELSLQRAAPVPGWAAAAPELDGRRAPSEREPEGGFCLRVSVPVSGR